VGIGQVGSDPTAVSNWRWFAAAETGGAGGVKAFAGAIKAHLSQTFDVAYRFSNDGGLSWIYADMDDADLEYSPDQAAKLVAEDPPPHYCLETEDCLLDGWRVVCKVAEDVKDNVCVECLESQDCVDNPKSLGPNCSVEYNRCYCEGDPDCVDNPNGALCTEGQYCGCQSPENCVAPAECVMTKEEMTVCQ
jgi:hypothetical protein